VSENALRPQETRRGVLGDRGGHFGRDVRAEQRTCENSSDPEADRCPTAAGTRSYFLDRISRAAGHLDLAAVCGRIWKMADDLLPARLGGCAEVRSTAAVVLGLIPSFGETD